MILLGSQNTASVEQLFQRNTNVLVFVFLFFYYSSDPPLYTLPTSKDTQEIKYLNFFFSILSNERKTNDYNFFFWNQIINKNLILYPPFDYQFHSRQNPISIEPDNLLSKRNNNPSQDEYIQIII